MHMTPTHTIFDKFDPKWCLEQCKYIINNFPMTESDISGKFFHTYKTCIFIKQVNCPTSKNLHK